MVEIPDMKVFENRWVEIQILYSCLYTFGILNVVASVLGMSVTSMQMRMPISITIACSCLAVSLPYSLYTFYQLYARCSQYIGYYSVPLILVSILLGVALGIYLFKSVSRVTIKCAGYSKSRYWICFYASTSVFLMSWYNGLQNDDGILHLLDGTNLISSLQSGSVFKGHEYFTAGYFLLTFSHVLIDFVYWFQCVDSASRWYQFLFVVLRYAVLFPLLDLSVPSTDLYSVALLFVSTVGVVGVTLYNMFFIMDLWEGVRMRPQPIDALPLTKHSKMTINCLIVQC
ncbi:hypothetical protein MP228_010267 [Amoeboaphelidium protococcarum]|nr:hypothetical protein MP228_010267 [Amoeboaphelidium protococcarum]